MRSNNGLLWILWYWINDDSWSW